MKQLLKLTIGLLIAACSSASAQGGNFTLNGKVGDFSSPAKAFLMYTDTAGKLRTDSTLMNAGGFSFRGVVDYSNEAWVI